MLPFSALVDMSSCVWCCLTSKLKNKIQQHSEMRVFCVRWRGNDICLDFGNKLTVCLMTSAGSYWMHPIFLSRGWRDRLAVWKLTSEKQACSPVLCCAEIMSTEFNGAYSQVSVSRVAAWVLWLADKSSVIGGLWMHQMHAVTWGGDVAALKIIWVLVYSICIFLNK